MFDFIEMADELRNQSSAGMDIKSFDLFFNVLRQRLRVLHATSVVNLQNIESVFGLIEMARLVQKLPLSNDSEIDQIATSTRIVLAETVERYCRFLVDKSGRVIPPPGYSAIIDWLVP